MNTISIHYNLIEVTDFMKRTLDVYIEDELFWYLQGMFTRPHFDRIHLMDDVYQSNL